MAAVAPASPRPSRQHRRHRCPRMPPPPRTRFAGGGPVAAFLPAAAFVILVVIAVACSASISSAVSPPSSPSRGEGGGRPASNPLPPPPPRRRRGNDGRRGPSPLRRIERSNGRDRGGPPTGARDDDYAGPTDGDSGVTAGAATPRNGGGEARKHERIAGDRPTTRIAAANAELSAVLCSSDDTDAAAVSFSYAIETSHGGVVGGGGSADGDNTTDPALRELIDRLEDRTLARLSEALLPCGVGDGPEIRRNRRRGAALGWEALSPGIVGLSSLPTDNVSDISDCFPTYARSESCTVVYGKVTVYLTPVDAAETTTGRVDDGGIGAPASRKEAAIRAVRVELIRLMADGALDDPTDGLNRVTYLSPIAYGIAAEGRGRVSVPPPESETSGSSSLSSSSSSPSSESPTSVRSLIIVAAAVAIIFAATVILVVRVLRPGDDGVALVGPTSASSQTAAGEGRGWDGFGLALSLTQSTSFSSTRSSSPPSHDDDGKRGRGGLGDRGGGGGDDRGGTSMEEERGDDNSNRRAAAVSVYDKIHRQTDAGDAAASLDMGDASELARRGRRKGQGDGGGIGATVERRGEGGPRRGRGDAGGREAAGRRSGGSSPIPPATDGGGIDGDGRGGDDWGTSACMTTTMRRAAFQPKVTPPRNGGGRNIDVRIRPRRHGGGASRGYGPLNAPARTSALTVISEIPSLEDDDRSRETGGTACDGDDHDRDGGGDHDDGDDARAVGNCGARSPGSAVRTE